MGEANYTLLLPYGKKGDCKKDYQELKFRNRKVDGKNSSNGSVEF